jgi:hypothetical protein
MFSVANVENPGYGSSLSLGSVCSWYERSIHKQWRSWSLIILSVVYLSNVLDLDKSCLAVENTTPFLLLLTSVSCIPRLSCETVYRSESLTQSDAHAKCCLIDSRLCLLSVARLLDGNIG